MIPINSTLQSTNNSFGLPVLADTNQSKLLTKPKIQNAVAIPIDDTSLLISAGSNIWDVRINNTPQDFTYDPSTNTIMFDSTQTGVLSFQTQQSTSTHRIITPILNPQVPQFLKDYLWEGEITIEKNFAEYPRVTGFKVKILKTQLDTIKTEIYNGRAVQFLNKNYFISNIKISEYSPRVFGADLLLIEFDFESVFAQQGDTIRSELDREYFTKDLRGNRDYILLSELYPYSGQPIKIKVDTEKNSEETLIFRNEFENRAITVNAFPYFSNSIPELKTWGQTPTHYFDESTIENKIFTVDLPGHGTEWSGVRLTKEYDKVELSLDKNEESDSGENNEIVLLKSGDLDYFVPPSDRLLVQYVSPDKLKTPANSFDAGGKTKEYIQTWVLNGEEIKTVTQLWGYRYTSLDVYTVQLENRNAGDPQSDEENSEQDINYSALYNVDNPSLYWGLIEEKTKTPKINSTTNYIIEEKEIGWKYQRFKNESSAEELHKIYAEWLDATQTGNSILALAKQKELELYTKWRKAPINDVTKYERLTPLNLFYDDLAEEDTENPALFCGLIKRLDFQEEIIENPFSTLDYPRSPIVVGKRLEERKETQIVIPQSGFLRKTPELFRTGDQKLSAEGENYKYTAIDNKYSYSLGRPSEHSKLDINSDRIKSAKQAPDNCAYYLFSPGSIKTMADKSSESVSFPGVSDPDRALHCAQTQFSMENTESAKTTTIDVKGNPGYNEGDCLVWLTNKWIIFGVSETFKVETNQKLIPQQTQLKLGYYLNPPLTQIKILKND